MDIEDFKKLREKYYNKTATLDERIKFIKLSLSGQYDDIDLEALKRGWGTDFIATEEEKQLLAGYKNSIILPREGKTRHLGTYTFWLAAAAAVIVLSVVGVWLYQGTTTDADRLTITAGVQHTIAGPAYVRLSDGSTVELQAGSVLEYNDGDFNVTSRDVKLTGTAYFDVQHNPALKFKVYSSRVMTTVLGTTFSVTQDEKSVQITVVKGKVSVGDSLHTYQMLSPNEQISVSTTSMQFVKRQVKIHEALKWKEQNIIMDKVTMKEALTKLEDHFNVQIKVTNEALYNCGVTAWFVNNESLNEILEQLCAVHAAKAVITGEIVTIEGGNGCP